MKQIVLINKYNGNLGVGIRMNFTDHESKHQLEMMKGYSVSLRLEGCDAWLLFNGNFNDEGPWIYIDKKIIEKTTEELGEL